jgi:hypothetical protein
MAQRVSLALSKAQEEARGYVVENGKRTGHEYGAAIASGKVIDRFTSNHQSQLNVPVFGQAVEIHHNHPFGDSLSRADLSMLLTREDIDAVFVHGHNGAAYSATKLVTATKADVEQASAVAAMNLAEAVDRKMISIDDSRSGIKMMIAAILLERKGLVAYTSNSKIIHALAERIADL